MKNLSLLVLVIFLFASCASDSATDEQDELSGVSTIANKDKVKLCHKGKIININGHALQAHLNHGDTSLVDADGDGYVVNENECGVPSGDSNDSNSEVNPGAEEICEGGIDENCPIPVAVGDYRDGGIVFWIDPNDNTKGLVTTPLDLRTNGGSDLFNSQKYKWGCDFDRSQGYDNLDAAEGFAIGTGEQNTLDILAGCSEPGIAARACADYSITIDGVIYDDWFLPSYDEMAEIYKNSVSIDATAVTVSPSAAYLVSIQGGTLSGLTYWSSWNGKFDGMIKAVCGPNTPPALGPNTGFCLYLALPNDMLAVRPVRAF